VRRLSYLKILRDPISTKLCLVRDINTGEYYVEKSLEVTIDFQKRLFENEVCIHSMLDHQYIIKFVEAVEDYRFLMEYAVNGNLQNIIDSNREEKFRIKLSVNFLKGLAYLHQLGYVHNDIKPSNILVTRDNRAKLADFTFSGKVGEVTFDRIPISFMLGTELFKPSQEKSRYVNLISNDIYAVGIVLNLLFSQGKVIEQTDPQKIKNPDVREIVQNCLNGSFKEVNRIIHSLSNLWSDFPKNNAS
jgi:serine/threonine protein kinase